MLIEKLIKQIKRMPEVEAIDFTGLKPSPKFIRHLSNESVKDMRIIAKIIKHVQETQNYDDIQKLSERFNLVFLSEVNDSEYVFVKRDSLTKYQSENGVVTISAFKGDSWFKDLDFKDSSDTSSSIEAISQFYLSLMEERETTIDPIKLRTLDYSIHMLKTKYGLDYFESEFFRLFTLKDLTLVINKETKEQIKIEIRPIRGLLSKLINVYSRLGLAFYLTTIVLIVGYSLQSIQIDVIAPYINFQSYVHEIGDPFSPRLPIQSIVDNQDSIQFIDLEVINPPNLTQPGTTNVVYRVRDRSNNTREQSTQIVVRDTTNPVIRESNISDTIEYDNLSRTNFLNLINATDNHRIASIEYRLPYENLQGYKPLGNYNVTYTATDPSGNSSTFVRRITVVDNVPPTFNLDRSNITVDFDQARTYNYLQHAENVRDNYDSELVRLEYSTNYNYANPGTYPFVITAIDASGNRTSRTLNVQVVDTTPPVLRVQSDLTLNVNDVNSFNPSSLIIESSDNHRIQSVTQSSVDILRNRVGTVSFETVAVDPSGNRTSRVTRIRLVDTTPPVIRVVRNSLSFLNRIPTMEEIRSMVTVTDNFDSNPSITYTGDLRANNNSSFTNTITIIATDLSGNRSTANVQILLRDTIAPELTFINAGLQLTVSQAQNSIYRYSQILLNDNYLSLVASVTDNISIRNQIAVTVTNSPYDITQVGTVNLQYRVTDNAGNVAIYVYPITTVPNPS